MKFLRSFRYAFRGIAYCIKNERNMRVHTAVALYVLVLSPFFELTVSQYAILFVTFSAVMAAEMFNTASEELADLTASNYNHLVRVAKDVAAGGVLICAVFAIAVGVCLFWQPAAFVRMWYYFVDKPYMAAALVFSLLLALVYVVLGPLGICDLARRGKEKRKKTGERP
ncbi:MAG: diacylglycerol kinase family protein [Clostridiales bacterium]|nr:diacylglycerol kinase family protein [Clostridiales bacterium]